MTKKPKYFVVCNCGKKIKITAEKICYRLDEYSSDCAVAEKVRVDRFWVVCTKCGNHPNVAKIIPTDMSRAIAYVEKEGWKSEYFNE
jgi:hypothetical protein